MCAYNPIVAGKKSRRKLKQVFPSVPLWAIPIGFFAGEDTALILQMYIDQKSLQVLHKSLRIDIVAIQSIRVRPTSGR